MLPEQRANLLAALGAWRNVRAQSRMGQTPRRPGIHEIAAACGVLVYGPDAGAPLACIHESFSFTRESRPIKSVLFTPATTARPVDLSRVNRGRASKSVGEGAMPVATRKSRRLPHVVAPATAASSSSAPTDPDGPTRKATATSAALLLEDGGLVVLRRVKAAAAFAAPQLATPAASGRQRWLC